MMLLREIGKFTGLDASGTYKAKLSIHCNTSSALRRFRQGPADGLGFEGLGYQEAGNFQDYRADGPAAG
jgi:hypothetical protein